MLVDVCFFVLYLGFKQQNKVMIPHCSIVKIERITMLNHIDDNCFYLFSLLIK